MADHLSHAALAERLRGFLSGQVKGQRLDGADDARSPAVRAVLAGLMLLAVAPALAGCKNEGTPAQPFAMTMVDRKVDGARIKEMVYRDLGLVCHQVAHDHRVGCETPRDLPARLAELAAAGEGRDSALASVGRHRNAEALTIRGGAGMKRGEWQSQSSLVVHYDTGRVCHVHGWTTRDTRYGYGYITYLGKFGYGYITDVEHHSRQDCVAIDRLSPEGRARLEAMRPLGQPKPPAAKPGA